MIARIRVSRPLIELYGDACTEPTGCVVAHAIKRALPGVGGVCVGHTSVFLYRRGGGRSSQRPLPPEATDLQRRLHAHWLLRTGQPVPPFFRSYLLAPPGPVEFDLDAPDWALGPGLRAAPVLRAVAS